MVFIDLIWFWSDVLPSPIQRKILAALAAALRPLVRALLSSGLGYREFSEIAKRSFVEVASTDYGIRGRRTNTSRIAVITGISRKEVRRLLDRDPVGAGQRHFGESPSSVVLHNWHNDPAYLDDEGLPALLSYAGSSPSFDSLVRACVGDIPSGAMRKELIRVGAVREEAGKLRALKPYFVPPGLSDRLILGLEEGAATILSTIAYNADPYRTASPRFQRIASVDGISEEFFPVIEEYTREALTKFGLEYCGYLDDYERQSKQSGKKTSRQIGIGLYYYDIELQ